MDVLDFKNFLREYSINILLRNNYKKVEYDKDSLTNKRFLLGRNILYFEH